MYFGAKPLKIKLAAWCLALSLSISFVLVVGSFLSRDSFRIKNDWAKLFILSLSNIVEILWIKMVAYFLCLNLILLFLLISSKIIFNWTLYNLNGVWKIKSNLFIFKVSICFYFSLWIYFYSFDWILYFSAFFVTSFMLFTNLVVFYAIYLFIVYLGVFFYVLLTVVSLFISLIFLLDNKKGLDFIFWIYFLQPLIYTGTSTSTFVSVEFLFGWVGRLHKFW